jgi:hypothetical protein
VVENAYRCVPAATAIIDLEGNVVFHSRGPKGVQPNEAARVLKELLGPEGREQQFPKRP